MDRYQFIKEFSELNLIVFRINRSIHQSMDGGCFRNVSGIQIQALFTLRAHDKLTMTELAGKLLMTRQQLTKIVNSLEEKGLVSRSTDPDNRRQVLIEITAGGNGFIENLLEVNVGRLAETLMEMGGEDGQRMLDAIITIKEVLANVAQNLTENQED